MGAWGCVVGSAFLALWVEFGHWERKLCTFCSVLPLRAKEDGIFDASVTQEALFRDTTTGSGPNSS